MNKVLAEKECIVFDLDDTLYPEEEYVFSGFKAICEFFNDDELYARLIHAHKENPQNVFQRVGFNKEQSNLCVEKYREHFPNISLKSDVKNMLEMLRLHGYKIGIITDGRPCTQWNKIKALDLEQYVNCIIVTDELGGVDFRKPNPIPYEIMKLRLETEFDKMVYVGDNPEKDFYIKSIYPITTVRVYDSDKKGIYFNRNYWRGITEDYRINNVVELLRLIKNV